jgi:hypothetical protein
MFNVYYQDDDRNSQLSNRIYERNLPGQAMNSIYDPRPQSTKYVQYPTTSSEKCNHDQHFLYNPTNHFNPGTKSPFSGYALHVDNESKMKNIFMVNQKSAPQTHYIPSTNSDMYKYQSFYHNPDISTHNLLQKVYAFSPHNPDKYNLNIPSTFHLHTRQNVKDIPL